MVEARLIYPNVCPVFHKFVGIVEHTVGSEWIVAFLRNHNLHLYTSFYSIFKCLLQFVVESEIWINEFY